MEEQGNDYNLYQSAFESVITHYHRVDKRLETEGLKEKKCAKENDKAKGNKLAIPSAPVPVTAPVPNAVAVAVVDTNPLYDDIVYPQTQSSSKKPCESSPTPPPLDNDTAIKKEKLTRGRIMKESANDEPMHSKKHS